MITALIGITAVNTSLMTRLKPNLVTPRELFKKKNPTSIVNKIQTFQIISFLIFHKADENIFENRLGINNKFRLNEKNITIPNPMINSYFSFVGKVFISKG